MLDCVGWGDPYTVCWADGACVDAEYWDGEGQGEV